MVAMVSMDGSPPGTRDLIVKKAKSASLIPLAPPNAPFPNSAIMNATMPGAPAWTLDWTNDGLVFYSGAYPLYAPHGKFLGTIGVDTTGYITDDDAAAQAAFKAVYAGQTMTPQTFKLLTSNGAMPHSGTLYAGELLMLSDAWATALNVFTSTTTPASISVRDAQGELKVFWRMDGAVLGSVDISQKVSRGSYWFPVPSEKYQNYVRPGQPYFTATQSSPVAIQGGAPLKNSNGWLVGSVGVSVGFVTSTINADLAAAAASSFANSAAAMTTGIAPPCPTHAPCPAAAECTTPSGFKTVEGLLIVLVILSLLGNCLQCTMRKPSDATVTNVDMGYKNLNS